MTTFPIVHVWSDIACPFCYIGKRRLMNALPPDTRVEWHSFILQPDQVTTPGINLTQFLAQSKGWSLEQTQGLQAQVVAMAAADGIVMNMDQVIPANTRRAHALIQAHRHAASAQLLVESLFKAYFEEGLNIDDEAVLADIHTKCAGTAAQWQAYLHVETQQAIDEDLKQAAQIGIQGVPFIYFENHFAIRGAREQVVFDQAVAQLLENQNPS
jgi:predicted DsbA family dithiol-disulfide isomerase